MTFFSFNCCGINSTFKSFIYIRANDGKSLDIKNKKLEQHGTVPDLPAERSEAVESGLSPEKMAGNSMDVKTERLEQLKKLFPEAFSEGKVDLEKLKCTLGDDINISNERYVLNWAGKSDAFRSLQAPTTATLVPDRDESINFDDTNHVFIEGENLEVLKALQKAYYGKVKMIYIDPPYNTGSDSFVYPDRFSERAEKGCVPFYIKW